MLGGSPGHRGPAPGGLHSTAPPGHTPADGHIHLQHRGVVPLQGGQAAVQVGGPQVEEADHHRQGQQRPLLLSGRGALRGEGRPSWQVPRLAGGRREGPPGARRGPNCLTAPLSPRYTHPGLWFKPHRKGVGTQVQERETEKAGGARDRRRQRGESAARPERYGWGREAGGGGGMDGCGAQSPGTVRIRQGSDPVAHCQPAP